MKRVSRILPVWAREPMKKVYDALTAIAYSGRGRWCPVCGKHSRKFAPFGNPPRPHAQCAHCGALERHRFTWLYFTHQTNLFDGSTKKVLHVAPERCFEPRLRSRLGLDYLTADLLDPRAMVKMDITNIEYPDGYFDVIYCSHVLEHIVDDAKAMREFHRVLKPKGWAVLLVPIDVEKTFEDTTVVDPVDRLRLFGQEDHVRIYGRDYVDRLRGAGFEVKVTVVSDLFEPGDIERMGLTPASGEIFFCTSSSP